MYPHALFLGQVRLAGVRLAQTLDPNSPYYDPAAAWREKIKDLMNSAKDLPDYVAIVQAGNACLVQVDNFSNSPTPQTSTDAQKCISDLEGKIQISRNAVARGGGAAAAPSTSTPAPSSQGIPSWGLVMGGVAAGLLGGYLIFKD